MGQWRHLRARPPVDARDRDEPVGPNFPVSRALCAWTRIAIADLGRLHFGFVARPALHGLTSQLVGPLVENDPPVAWDVHQLGVPSRDPLLGESHELLIRLGLPALLQDANRILTIGVYDDRGNACRNPLESPYDSHELGNVVRRLAEILETLVQLAPRLDDHDAAPRRPR